MSDQYLRMGYTDDSRNEVNWRQEPIGEVGEYGKRISFERLGQFRQRTVRIQISSPRKRDFLGVVGVVK